AREGRDDALLVVADLTEALRPLLLGVVGEVGEVAAHEPLWHGAVLRTGLLVEIGDLLEAAVAHGGGERGDDESASEPGGELDGGSGKGRDISRQGLLHGLRGDGDVREGIVLASVRGRRRGLPQTPDRLHALLEDPLIVVERYVERQILAAVVATPGGEIDAAATQEVERRPLLGDANGMMEREHGHGWRKAHMP